jgi:hypothetical protein
LTERLGGHEGISPSVASYFSVSAYARPHDLLGRQYQRYGFLMRQQQTQAALAEAQAQATSTTAAVLLALAQTGNQLLRLKILTDQESQAGRLGMIVKARASYDPDFALVLNCILARQSPTDGRFEALQ